MIRSLIRLVPADARGRLTTYVVLSLISVIVRAASALLLVPLLVALFSPHPADAWPWVGALTAVTAGGWVIDMTLARIGFGIGFTLADTTQHAMANRLTETPLRWFTADNTATARQAIAASAPDLVGFVANLLSPFLGALLLPAAITVGLFLVSWPVGVAAAIALPFMLGALAASQRLVRTADAADAAAHSALTERLVEFARTQQALRASRRVTAARSQTGEAIGAVRGATQRLLLFQIPGQLLFSVASQIALILLAGTITTLTLRGDLGAPAAVALTIVMVRFLEPFTVLADLSGAMESSRGLLDRLNIVTSAPLDTAATGRPVPGGESHAPRIEFRSVGFGYGDTEVLRDVSFTLEPATTTAVVGPSGSGKSTILSLIAGLHTPLRGQILVDGTDITELDAEARRALVSVVFQHPYLFDGTIADNIRVGHPDAGDDTMHRAMALARVDDIVERLPDGALSKVGEAGTALSGGERQRVSIARALVKPAGVLLIDEATSALDTENEASITQAISDDPHQRTRVIIAHRLDAIRNADQVLFVDGGVIVEQGAIDELTTLGGRFAEFWRQQQTSAGWQIAADAPGRV
ncbi:ATP-binding cassette subfamily B protein IrtB [Mycolicibacterium sp. BK556]|uniref:ABC transporter ATP-binding protein n=1 Tax=unclassified Mycolicibacterium TaxID=2636767 RepID=UPI001609CCD9|nr:MULTISPECIES: ABC transporter ATP-binding protein [unclassified Mycolicibacterium]MBB3601406.1 ATP-binding cassette subfamily B protein IrtB [Mycolicibacterium sp. BK556]MBB3631158.1 ATP-binding cassette subfamily B protein IrtB [Mycolicibacterium sp. BK607]